MRVLARRVQVVVLGLVLAIVLAACGSSGPVAVESVTLMRDDGSGKPGETVTAFKPTDSILHAEAKLNQTVTNFSGKAAWVAVETTAGNDIVVAETELSGVAANVINTQVELPREWPTGRYKVDFYQGETLLKSQEFSIQP